MGEGTDSGGVISKEQLDQLVTLYDRWHYALDPESRDAKEAQSEFNTLIDSLYGEVLKQGFKLAESKFRAFVYRECQAAIVAGQKKEHRASSIGVKLTLHTSNIWHSGKGGSFGAH